MCGVFLIKIRKTPVNQEIITILIHLIKLGMKPYAAHGMSYAKGYARICCSWNLHKYISKERLAKFGLISMLDYYTERCVTC